MFFVLKGGQAEGTHPELKPICFTIFILTRLINEPPWVALLHNMDTMATQYSLLNYDIST